MNIKNNCKRIFGDWQYAFGWITISVFTVAVLTSIFLIVLTVNTEGPAEFNYLDVTGTGEVVATVDVATFNFTVTETSESVESAQEGATERVNNILGYLEDNGVEEKDLKTQGYNVYPRYEYVQELCKAGEFCPPTGKRQIVGYEVSQSVEVKVRDVSTAGDMLVGIGQFHTSSISGLTFTTDDTESLIEEARNLAIAEAKQKAKDLAKELGVHLDDLVNFSDSISGGQYDNHNHGYDYRTLSLEAVSESPSLPTGEREVSVTVYLTYSID